MNQKGIFLSLFAILLIGGAVYFISSKDNNILENSDAIQMPVTSGENPTPGSSVHDLPIEPAAVVARQDLATKLSVEATSIVIMSVLPKTWNDGCLGLGKAEESCLQALVPGFKVEMLAKGETYFYRTDVTGTSIRQEN
ncbi:hypothetical protein EPO56_03205 [Patescibacteria group bacterium]|nr:MAG: hypothetical protein EPO56_03205 [Patescibacteria group bacterium]